MVFSMRTQVSLIILALSLASGYLYAKSPEPTREDPEHIRRWNGFADHLLQLHQAITHDKQVKTVEKLGGYAGLPDFYREITYIDTATQRVLSRIQWETERSDTPHVIEVNVYNDQGQLVRDYLAAYLPYARNAPIQTLVNLHHYGADFHAFRQFDASGNLIYEQCLGKIQGKEVALRLWEQHLSDRSAAVFQQKDYKACFYGLLNELGPYANPLVDRPGATTAKLKLSPMTGIMAVDTEALERQLAELSQRIRHSPREAQLYLQRGAGYFLHHDYDLAIADYDRALALDATLDEAYFGRGMARGHVGEIAAGIDDLGVYLQRHPDDSYAYTKRGVRYLWLGEEAKARTDLEKAITLNPANAEAHDDLGVIYARQGDFDLAIAHFNETIRHDPSYQKGYHNLALVLHTQGQDAAALVAIDKALKLDAHVRSSLLLKGEILQSLGRKEAAAQVMNEAEFMPEGNWSEQLSVQ